MKYKKKLWCSILSFIPLVTIGPILMCHHSQTSINIKNYHYQLTTYQNKINDIILNNPSNTNIPIFDIKDIRNISPNILTLKTNQVTDKDVINLIKNNLEFFFGSTCSSEMFENLYESISIDARTTTVFVSLKLGNETFMFLLYGFVYDDANANIVVWISIPIILTMIIISFLLIYFFKRTKIYQNTPCIIDGALVTD